MEAGMQVDPDPTDEVVVHAATDWDIQKRADYEQDRGPREPVYSSRKTRQTALEESKNQHHEDDQTNP